MGIAFVGTVDESYVRKGITSNLSVARKQQMKKTFIRESQKLLLTMSGS